MNLNSWVVDVYLVYSIDSNGNWTDKYQFKYLKVSRIYAKNFIKYYAIVHLGTGEILTIKRPPECTVPN